MNATSFQSNALTWLAAACVVLPVATGFVVKLLGAVGQVKSAITDLRSRQDAQSKHLISQQQQITSIALATQPPANLPPSATQPTTAITPPAL